jgi:Ca2+-binding EF-hand superfamily protein
MQQETAMTSNLNLTATFAAALTLAAGGALAQTDTGTMTCADLMTMGQEGQTGATDGTSSAHMASDGTDTGDLLSAMMATCEGNPGLLAADGLAHLQFRDIDADHDGQASSDEFSAYSDLVLVSMDSDGSGDLSEQEFTSWGFGMQNLADAAGTRQGYDTALRVIFDYWDRDNDAAISAAERSDASMSSFAYADTSGDAMLNEAEFRDNVLLNIALRTALTTAP